VRPGDVIDGTPSEVEAVLADAPMGTLVARRDSVWQSENGEWELLGSGAPGLPWTSREVAGYLRLAVLRWGSGLPTPTPDVQAIDAILEAHRQQVDACACGWSTPDRHPLSVGFPAAHRAHQAEMIAEGLR
jgi:hypothetical protein